MSEKYIFAGHYSHRSSTLYLVAQIHHQAVQNLIYSPLHPSGTNFTRFSESYSIETELK